MFIGSQRARAARTGRPSPAPSLCGYLEFLMIKPLIPDHGPVPRGGVTSP